MSGEELTARFFEACGRLVGLVECDELPPSHKPYWTYCDETKGSMPRDWEPVPDLTRPERLHDVVAMVRERWPTDVMEMCSYEDENKWEARCGPMSMSMPDEWSESESLNEALMLAAIRAAGLEVPE